MASAGRFRSSSTYSQLRRKRICLRAMRRSGHRDGDIHRDGASQQHRPESLARPRLRENRRHAAKPATLVIIVELDACRVRCSPVQRSHARQLSSIRHHDRSRAKDRGEGRAAVSLRRRASEWMELRREGSSDREDLAGWRDCVRRPKVAGEQRLRSSNERETSYRRNQTPRL